MQKTNKVLRQLDRNKLEFIQVAAHELRTPLTVLIGYVDVLKSFPDIEVTNLPSGKPKLTLSGKCREIADQLGLDEILISISHIETHAIASAIGTGA